MTMPSLIWGSPQSLATALLLLGVATVVLVWSYGRARASRSVRIGGAILKGLGFTALALILLEPLLTGSRPRRGANAFVILADNSQSLRIRDGKTTPTRGEWVRDRLATESAWKTRLGQDFDVRRYVFDSHLRAVDGFDGLAFDGTGSTLATSLTALSRRFHGLPLAGILLFTDGNRTDAGDVDWSQLPPVYPVVPPSRGVERDVGVVQVSISQTNFESAPVVIRADVAAVGFAGETIVAAVTDEAGKELERQEAKATGDDKPLGFRFQFRPEHKGVNFYRVQAFPATEEPKDKTGRRRCRRDERADAGQQQPARRRRSGGRPLPGALRGRTAQLGVQVPPPRHRRGRAGPARRPAADRPAPAEVRLPRRARPGELAPLPGVRPPRRRFGRARRPAGPGPPRHARRGRAAGRVSQGRRRAVPLPRRHPRRHRGRLLHPGPTGAACGTS